MKIWSVPLKIVETIVDLFGDPVPLYWAIVKVRFWG